MRIGALVLAATLSCGCSLTGLFDAPPDVACDVDAECEARGTPDPCLRPFCETATGACRFHYRDTDEDGDGDHRCATFDAVGTAEDCDDADPIESSVATEACDGFDQDCDERIDEECISPDALVAGEEFTCAIRRGEVLCWGASEAGQLGRAGARRTEVGRPVPIFGLADDIVEVAGGTRHACALSASGLVSCWGAASAGQLGGRVTGTMSVEPVSVAITGVTHVCAGFEHSCALTSEGALWCWGQNAAGVIGGALPSTIRLPVLVRPSGVDAVACGAQITCFHETDGSMLCQGDGAIARVAVDTPRAMTTGQGFECQIEPDGGVRCIGEGRLGQLGDGLASSTFDFVAVRGLRDVVALRAGRSHVCAIDGTERVWCWGGSGSGESGSGMLPMLAEPTEATGLGTARGIATGGAHTCAIGADGPVRCVGANLFGQSGSPPESYVLTPRVVRGI